MFISKKPTRQIGRAIAYPRLLEEPTKEARNPGDDRLFPSQHYPNPCTDDTDHDEVASDWSSARLSDLTFLSLHVPIRWFKVLSSEILAINARVDWPNWTCMDPNQCHLHNLFVLLKSNCTILEIGSPISDGRAKHRYTITLLEEIHYWLAQPSKMAYQRWANANPSVFSISCAHDLPSHRRWTYPTRCQSDTKYSIDSHDSKYRSSCYSCCRSYSAYTKL